MTSENSATPSDQLQEAEIAIQTDYTCNLDLGLAYSSASMLCAGKLATSSSSNDGVDSCFGDSGGPLLIKDLNGVVRQAGVTSWGYGCASSKYYGVWSRVAALAPWIAANIPLDPVVRAAPVVRGTPVVGQLLDCEGAVFDGAGLSTSYYWEDSAGAKLSSVANASYLPMSGDVGKTVRCTVTVTTPSGAIASASSLWIGPITAATTNKDTKAPVVKKLKVRCKKGQCTISVQVSDPAPSASGVRSVVLQATWNRTNCSVVNKRKFCVSRSEKLSPAFSSQDKTYRYYNLAVPGRGKATIEVLATDNRGNVSAKKTFKVSVS